MPPSFSTAYIDPLSVSDEGIVEGRSCAFGIGALLILRCAKSKRVLMGRKSARDGFEGSDQFTFPGGMLRSEQHLDFQSCLAQTLQARVMAETGVSTLSLKRLVALDHRPPIVGRYTIRGNQLVSAAILPVFAETSAELAVSANDPTVYSVDWYDPIEVMHEVTQTNALIVSQLLWAEWSESERRAIKPILVPHFEAVRENAEIVGACAPIAPWL